MIKLECVVYVRMIFKEIVTKGSFFMLNTFKYLLNFFTFRNMLLLNVV
jgi:hypothetical protein